MSKCILLGVRITAHTFCWLDTLDQTHTSQAVTVEKARMMVLPLVFALGHRRFSLVVSNKP